MISGIFCESFKQRFLLACLGVEAHTIDHASHVFLSLVFLRMSPHINMWTQLKADWINTYEALCDEPFPKLYPLS